MQVNIRPNWLIIPAIALITLLIGKHFTSGNMLWYSTLNLPIITPPNWFFSRIWLIIYTLTTSSALIIFNTFKRDLWFWIIQALFLINAFLNMYWTYVFFGQHQVGSLSIICALLLAITTWLLIYLIWPRSLLSSMLLLPYGAWIIFELLLNIWIVLIN